MDEVDESTDLQTEETTAPASQPLHVVPTVVVPVGEDEAVAMLADQSRFAGDEELKGTAIRLLEAGYTVNVVAARLKIRPTTVWTWTTDAVVQSAVKAGQARRKAVLGEGLESAAETALSALVDVAGDIGAPHKDRIKASEVILDRCGITPAGSGAGEGGTVAVSIDLDFDERLARIVAGSKS
jgi:hypothetical protein